MFLSRHESSRLENKIVELNEARDSYIGLIESRDEQLAHSRLGMSLLYRMALSDNHRALFAFLNSIPAESLACKVMDLPDAPSIRLVVYGHHPKSLDGTYLPLDQRKIAYVMIQSDSLDVVDCVMSLGFGGVGNSLNGPYTTSGSLPDGTQVKYRISPTGFERIQ